MSNYTNIMPNMTSNSQNGFLVSSSSDLGQHTQPYRMFSYSDPVDVNDCWHGAVKGLPTTITIEFPSEYIIDSYDIRLRKYAPTQQPLSWDFMISTNGTDFIKLNSVSDVEKPADTTTQYQIAQTKCKAIRFVIKTAKTQTIEMCCAIARMKIYGIRDLSSDKFTIHKTLKNNLPTNIDNTKDQLHFTEDGGIYISNKNGTFVQCGVTRKEFDDLKQLSTNNKTTLATAISGKGIVLNGSETMEQLIEIVKTRLFLVYTQLAQSVDDRHSAIAVTYMGDYNGSGRYNMTYRQSSNSDNQPTIRFNFTGTSIEYFGSKEPNNSFRSAVHEIYIDGVKYIFSQANAQSSVSSASCFRKTDLQNKEHYVEIKGGKNNGDNYRWALCFDYIKIDDTGVVKPYKVL